MGLVIPTTFVSRIGIILSSRILGGAGVAVLLSWPVVGQPPPRGGLGLQTRHRGKESRWLLFTPEIGRRTTGPGDDKKNQALGVTFDVGHVSEGAGGPGAHGDTVPDRLGQ